MVPFVGPEPIERELIPLFYKRGDQALRGDVCPWWTVRGGGVQGAEPQQVRPSPSRLCQLSLWPQRWSSPQQEHSFGWASLLPVLTCAPRFGTGPTWRPCRRSWRSWSSMNSSGSASRPFWPRSRRWGNWRMMTLRRSVSWVPAMEVWCSRSPTSRPDSLWPERWGHFKKKKKKKGLNQACLGRQVIGLSLRRPGGLETRVERKLTFHSVHFCAVWSLNSCYLLDYR